MSGDNSAEREGLVGRRVRRIVVAVSATIVLGAVGSGLWDLLFRPGIGSIGRFITGLSGSIDNAVFAMAALDPLPLPTLVIILLLTQLPLFGAFAFLFFGFVDPPLRSFLERRYKLAGTGRDELRRLKKRMIALVRITSLVGVITSLLGFFAALTAFTVVNEATLVWRVFHRNIGICAPFMTTAERDATVSLFRSMKTRSDFAEIRHTLDETATAHGKELEWYGKK